MFSFADHTVPQQLTRSAAGINSVVVPDMHGLAITVHSDTVADCWCWIRLSPPFPAALGRGHPYDGDPFGMPPDVDLDWGDFFFNLVSMCIVYVYFSKAAVGNESVLAILLCMGVAAFDIVLLVMRWLWYEQYINYGSVVLYIFQVCAAWAAAQGHQPACRVCVIVIETLGCYVHEVQLACHAATTLFRALMHVSPPLPGVPCCCTAGGQHLDELEPAEQDGDHTQLGGHHVAGRCAAVIHHLRRAGDPTIIL